MKLSKLARSTPFRLTMYYALSFWLSVIVLFAGVYFLAEFEFDEEVLERLSYEQVLMRDLYDDRGMNAFTDVIAKRTAENANRIFFYQLWDENLRPIAGNLSQFSSALGVHNVLLPEIDHDELEGDGQANADIDMVPGLMFTKKLTDAPTPFFLSVALRKHRTDELQDILLVNFGLAFAVSLVIAIGVGFAMGQISMRRIAEITVSSRDIMAGNMSRRLPVSGSGDELDQLSGNINIMLARIEQLMENVKHVSNDIAHDLRTPLGHLRQRLEGALNSEMSVRDHQEALQAAIVHTDTILATFNALLRIGQIEAGSVRARFSSVNISELLAQITESFEAAAEAKRQKLNSALAPNVIIKGDRELLVQMFVNLLDNALIHSQPGASINVVLEKNDTMFKIVIADSGPGIPAEHRYKVFQPFHRLDTSRHTPGNGLGLALVKSIAERHEIKIALKDNEPGLVVASTGRLEDR